MAERGAYRRHAPEFKLQVCREIRSGLIGRREAQKKYSLSDNLIQAWLAQFDRGPTEPPAISETVPETVPATVDKYRERIAALERKVGQLTMALDDLAAPPKPAAVRPVDPKPS